MRVRGKAWRAFAALAAAALALSPVGADDAGHVKAELAAGVRAAAPGGRFLLGVRFETAPHWHIYWRNPGDAGLATRVLWRLPEGFEAGDLRWPVPSRFEEAGGLVAYGYEGQVLLFTEVKAPPGIRAGQTVRLAAEVSWLACKEICVPGRATVSIDLAVADDAAPANEALFAEWQGRVPAGFGRPDCPFAVEPVRRTRPGNDRTRLTIVLRWREPPGDVSAFPGPAEGAEAVLRGCETRGTETRIELDVKRLRDAGHGPGVLEVVVGYPDRDGKRRAVSLPVLVDSGGG